MSCNNILISKEPSGQLKNHIQPQKHGRAYYIQNLQVFEWRTWSQRPRLGRHRSAAPKSRASFHEAERTNTNEINSHNKIHSFVYYMCIKSSVPNAESHLHSVHPSLAEIPLHLHVYLNIPHVTVKRRRRGNFRLIWTLHK